MGILRHRAEPGAWLPSYNLELACGCELIVAEYRLDTTFWVLDADGHVLTHGDESNGTDDRAALAVAKDRAVLAHARMCPRSPTDRVACGCRSAWATHGAKCLDGKHGQPMGAPVDARRREGGGG